MTVPLRDQIVEIEKEIRDRGRRYPVAVAKGRLLQATADAKLAALRAVQSTLTWLEANEGWIRAEAQRRARAAREAAEIAELGEHPAAIALQETFPGAEIVGVADLQPLDDASSDHLTTDHLTI